MGRGGLVPSWQRSELGPHIPTPGRQALPFPTVPFERKDSRVLDGRRHPRELHGCRSFRRNGMSRERTGISIRCWLDWWFPGSRELPRAVVWMGSGASPGEPSGATCCPSSSSVVLGPGLHRGFCRSQAHGVGDTLRPGKLKPESTCFPANLMVSVSMQSENLIFGIHGITWRP